MEEIFTIQLILTISAAILGWFTVAYESALQELSISRLDDMLEDKKEHSRTINPEDEDIEKTYILRNIIEDRDNFRLSASLASSLFLGYFLIFIIPFFINNDILHLITPAKDSIPAPINYINTLIPVLCALIITAILRGSAQAIGERKSERLVYSFAIPAWILTLIFRPISYILLNLFKVIARGIGFDVHKKQDEMEDDVIAAVTDGELAGIMNEEQREMIERVFDFNDTDIADIFTPRTDMESISITEPLSNAIKISLHSGHSRLPVHEDTRDNVIGIFYVRDALKYWEFEDKPRLSDIIRNPTFVPETQKVVSLLQVMQTSHTQIAIVLDEYGGTAGLVTIEDILEELVGEIQDEYDQPEDYNDVIAHSKDHVICEGQTHVSDINKALDEDILPEDDDYETVGGFVLDNLGHIPHIGEEFIFSHIRVKVLDADERRVLKVELRREKTDKKI